MFIFRFKSAVLSDLITQFFCSKNVYFNLLLFRKRHIYQIQLCIYISKYLVTFTDAVKNLALVVGNLFADACFFKKIIFLSNISQQK